MSWWQKQGTPGTPQGLAAPPGFPARVEDLRSHQQPSPQLGEQIWAEFHSSFLEKVLWPQIFHGFIMFKQKIQLAIHICLSPFRHKPIEMSGAIWAISYDSQKSETRSMSHFGN